MVQGQLSGDSEPLPFSQFSEVETEPGLRPPIPEVGRKIRRQWWADGPPWSSLVGTPSTIPQSKDLSWAPSSSPSWKVRGPPSSPSAAGPGSSHVSQTPFLVINVPSPVLGSVDAFSFSSPAALREWGPLFSLCPEGTTEVQRSQVTSLEPLS